MTKQIPAANADKGKKATKSLRPLMHLVPYLGRYKGLVAGASIFLLAAAVTTLTLPVAVRRVIDFGFSGEDTQLVNNYFAVLLFVAGLLAFASALRYFFVITLGERIVSDLRRDVFAHVMTLSASFYDSAQSGEIVS
ncbi:MAG: ABC transporter transmembrane domain-containing protein, partial [Ahrensia sp.]